MIVPMKKVRVIIQSKDAEGAINELGRLGLVHIEHQTAPSGKNIEELTERLSIIDKALNILSSAEFAREKTGGVLLEPLDHEVLQQFSKRAGHKPAFDPVQFHFTARCATAIPLVRRR